MLLKIVSFQAFLWALHGSWGGRVGCRRKLAPTPKQTGLLCNAALHARCDIVRRFMFHYRVAAHCKTGFHSSRPVLVRGRSGGRIGWKHGVGADAGAVAADDAAVKRAARHARGDDARRLCTPACVLTPAAAHAVILPAAGAGGAAHLSV